MKIFLRNVSLWTDDNLFMGVWPIHEEDGKYFVEFCLNVLDYPRWTHVSFVKTDEYDPDSLFYEGWPKMRGRSFDYDERDQIFYRIIFQKPHKPNESESVSSAIPNICNLSSRRTPDSVSCPWPIG